MAAISATGLSIPPPGPASEANATRLIRAVADALTVGDRMTIEADEILNSRALEGGIANPWTRTNIMTLPTIISPSILSADFSRLGEEVRAVDAAGADWIHLDVMDGHFVPNITFGPDIISAIRPCSTKKFDCHLMISPADPFIESFAKAGADLVTVHAEAGPHLDRSLQAIKAEGKEAGVSICPATPLSHIEHVLDRLDLILVMTVNPGFGGQRFIMAMLEKLRALRTLIGDRPIHIQVDGGINPETAPLALDAGANVLVAGSAIFTKDDYAKAIQNLRAAPPR